MYTNNKKRTGTQISETGFKKGRQNMFSSMRKHKIHEQYVYISLQLMLQRREWALHQRSHRPCHRHEGDKARGSAKPTMKSSPWDPPAVPSLSGYHWPHLGALWWHRSQPLQPLGVAICCQQPILEPAGSILPGGWVIVKEAAGFYRQR
jgi:hypothetical protein